MSQEKSLELIYSMLTMAGYISLPILAATLVVGLLISILQVATQIQDMTLTFVPKIAVAVLVVFLWGPWMLATLVQFTRNAFAVAAAGP